MKKSFVILVFISPLFSFSERKFAADYSDEKRSLETEVVLNENGIKVAPFEQDFASCKTENITNLDTEQKKRNFYQEGITSNEDLNTQKHSFINTKKT